MPKLAKFEFTRLDLAGNPIVGAVLTLTGQGATVSAGGPTSFTVDSPGSIRAAGIVLGVSADGLTERSGTVSVTSTTATNVTTGSSISGMVNNDRIVNTVGQSIFKDEAGNESAGASITTDANGYASCYLQREPLDVKSVGGTSPLGTAVNRYWFDISPSGGFWQRTNDHPNAGTNVIRRYDCPYDTMANGDRLVEYRTNSVVRWYVGLNASLVAVVPVHNVAGTLTVDSGGLIVTSGDVALTAGQITMAAASSKLVPGATSFGIRNNANSLDNLTVVDAGDVTVRRDIDNRRIGGTRGTAVVAGDFVLSSGWGATATVSNITSTSNDTRGQIRITANGAGVGAQPSVVFTYKDGTYTTSPFVVATGGTNFTDLTDKNYWYVSSTATAATFIYAGTAVAARVYELNWVVLK